MQRIEFTSNGFLTLTLTLLCLEIHAKRYYLWKQENSSVYSNVSNENFLINNNYFIFLENLNFLWIACKIGCPPINIMANETIQLIFQTVNYAFQEDVSINLYIMFENESFSCVINITFIDKLDEIIFSCPTESYFTTDDNGYIPSCLFEWSVFPELSAKRNNTYFSSIKLWDMDKNRSQNALYPYDNKYIYHLKVICNIFVIGANRVVGHVDRIAKVYLIDSSKYICKNHTGRAILVNILERFTFECNYILDIPFLDDEIQIEWGNIVYYKWYMNYTIKFDPNLFTKPRTVTLTHFISFLSGRRNYALKRIIFILYVKFGSSVCNKGYIYDVNTLESFSCYAKHPYPDGFYIKIRNLSNQIPESLLINGLKCQVLKSWLPDIVTNVTGKMFITDIGYYLNESEREIMDFTMLIKKTVIRKLIILPDSLSINLPDQIQVSCQTGGVPVLSYFWTANNFSRSFNGCSFFITIPELNLTSITVFVALKYEYYWYNASRIYLIGRIPSIVIITSKFPIFSKGVLCYTDGENSLYTFQWICNDSNQPKDLIAVKYITSVSNNLIFHETAPLISFNCLCQSTYRDVFGREIFAISADVELNLRANELIDCELAKTMMEEITWTIIVIYILIFFMIPSVFFLIAYFVTDVRTKSNIQSKVFNQLGFNNENDGYAETIPHFIIARSDVGNIAFNHFLKRIVDLDKTIEALKLFRKSIYEFRFSKRISLNSDKEKPNLDEARATLSRLLTRNEDLYKLRSSQCTSSKLETFESNKSSTSTTISFSKRVNKVPLIPPKSDYMSSFGKNNEDDLTENKPHNITVGIEINDLPFENHDSLMEPLKKRKSYNAISNSTTIMRLKQIICDIPDHENIFSFEKITSEHSSQSDLISFPKFRRRILERETILSFPKLINIPTTTEIENKFLFEKLSSNPTSKLDSYSSLIPQRKRKTNSSISRLSQRRSRTRSSSKKSRRQVKKLHTASSDRFQIY